MNCTNCGQALTPGSQFCGNCGAQNAQPVAQTQPAQPVQPAQPAQPIQQPVANPAPAPVAAGPMPVAPAPQQPVATAPAQPGQPMQPVQQPGNYQMPPGQPMPGGPIMPGVGVGPKAQKNIKIFGWLGVVIGAINAVLGPLLINFLLNSSEVASQVTVDQSALGVAIAIAVISGLVILGIGAMALRNKNNAQAVKPYLIAGIVATILAILSAMGNGNAPPVLFIIFGAYGGIAYNNIRSGQ